MGPHGQGRQGWRQAHPARRRRDRRQVRGRCQHQGCQGDRHRGWLDGSRQRPESTKMIQNELSDCKTIIWNGPMGVFEMEKFAAGTNDVAKTLAECTGKGAITIIGGGDSVAAVEKAGLADKMSHISTCGGASLELLEGLVLPGVDALTEA